MAQVEDRVCREIALLYDVRCPRCGKLNLRLGGVGAIVQRKCRCGITFEARSRDNGISIHYA